MPSFAVFLLCLLTALAAADHLSLSALLSDSNGNLRFECWEVAAPFTKYPTIGMAVTGFADVSNVSYVVLPPRSSEGFHKPPHPMLFVLLSGHAHVTIPGHWEDELWISEGFNSVMIAADVVGEGHVTDYPSDKETHALQIPLRDGKLPEHRVLSGGVCRGNVGGVGGVGGGEREEMEVVLGAGEVPLL